MPEHTHIHTFTFIYVDSPGGIAINYSTPNITHTFGLLITRQFFTVIITITHLSSSRKLTPYLELTSIITRVALYSLLADHTENSASVVGTCLSNHCIATVAVLAA
jgi:hypothetical protein